MPTLVKMEGPGELGLGDCIEIMRKNETQASFLKRVLTKALANGHNHNYDQQLLVIVALHAVILDSGFILVDKFSGLPIDCSDLLDQWPSKASTTYLRYTLPEIVANASDRTKSVILKFQRLGHLLNVYASLSVESYGLHRVCFHKYKIAPALNSILRNSGPIDRKFQTKILNFWKIVKDKLAFPLLIDLCDKAGLCPPLCFISLPSELKFKIAELLHGVDLAKLACTCKEMKSLCSDNALWKRMVEKEYGLWGTNVGRSFCYKKLFGKRWGIIRMRERQDLAFCRANPFVLHPLLPSPIWGPLGGPEDREFAARTPIERQTNANHPPWRREPGRGWGRPLGFPSPPTFR